MSNKILYEQGQINGLLACVGRGCVTKGKCCKNLLIPIKYRGTG